MKDLRPKVGIKWPRSDSPGKREKKFLVIPFVIMVDFKAKMVPNFMERNRNQS